MNNDKISLCIPTMDRFDTFLNSYLKKYIEYGEKGLIDEIVINDETGNDYNKIIQNYNTDLLRVYKNIDRLGPFLNKLKVCSYAKNEYIVLMDSDNFADENYFINLKEYISKNSKSLSKHFILSPSFAKPRFNYKQFENNIVTKENLNNYKRVGNFSVLMNTGNYLLSRSIFNDININDTNISKSVHSSDVIYFNTLCFQQFEDFQFHILENLEYEHVVHDESCYLKNFQDENMSKNCNYVHSLFHNL